MFSRRYVYSFVVGVSIFGLVSCGSDKTHHETPSAKAPQPLWSALPMAVKGAGGESKEMVREVHATPKEFSVSDHLYFEGFINSKNKAENGRIGPSGTLSVNVNCWVPGNPDSRFQHRLDFNESELNEPGIPVLSLLPVGVLEKSVAPEQNFVTSCVMDFLAKNNLNQTHRFVFEQVLIRNLQKHNQIGIRKFAQDQDELRSLEIKEEEFVHYSLNLGRQPSNQRTEIKLACLDFSLQQKLLSEQFQFSEFDFSNARPTKIGIQDAFHRTSSHKCRLFLLENGKITMTSQRFVLKPQVSVPLVKSLPVKANLKTSQYELTFEIENPYSYDLPIRFNNTQANVRVHSVGLLITGAARGGGMGPETSKFRFVYNTEIKSKLSYQGFSQWLITETPVLLRGRSIAKLTLHVPMDPCGRIPVTPRGEDIFEFFEVTDSAPTLDLLHPEDKFMNSKSASVVKLALLQSRMIVVKQGQRTNSVGAAMTLKLGRCNR